MSARLVRHQHPSIVIAGGGVAALEALLALRALAGHVTEITLLSPTREFLYRPVTVAEAFDRGEARSYDLEQFLGDDGGTRIVPDALERVIAGEHVAVTGSGERIPYDALVIATGAVPREPLPGALTFRGRQDVAALRELLGELTAGLLGSVTFALPVDRMWPLPLYELALMTAAHVRARQVADLRISLVTPEHEPLGLFGPEAVSAIGPLLDARGIELHSSSIPARVEDGSLLLAGGERVPSDRVVTVPVLEGPRIDGVPHDGHGFIPVDRHGRVRGLQHVFAAGDVTAFSIKQGGLAAQQADAVAEAIAADLGAAITPQPFSPVLRGMLLTGGAPLYLRCEPDALPSLASTPGSGGSPAPGRRSSGNASAAAGQALWWPPAKLAGRHLASHLASARPGPLSSGELIDRAAAPGPTVDDSELQEALDLSLLLADCDARWGDYGSALDALAAAEALTGALPAEFEAKRRTWTAARRHG